MKNKPLLSNLHLVFILLPIAYCLLPAFAFAQPAKTADKPVKSELPSIIKKIDIPWPVSAAVDEKENKVFVLSAAGENSAVVVVDGKTNSQIKKIAIKREVNINSAGNSMAYDSNTNRVYAVIHTSPREELIAVIDVKRHEVLSIIPSPFGTKTVGASVNLSKKHNMAYVTTRAYPYLYGFNAANYKLEQDIDYGGEKGGVRASSISEDWDFLYISTGSKFLKLDIKAKKVSGSLPITAYSIPAIDEKNGLIFVGEPYKLHIIDLKTFKLKDTREDIPVSQAGGFSIALNPATNHLFVPTYGDSVSVIDVPSMKILTTIKVGQTIKSIAVNSKTNRVYVTLVNEENKVVVIQDR